MTDATKDPRRSLAAILPWARQFLANTEDDRSRYLKYPELRERVAQDGRGEASVRAVAFWTQLELARDTATFSPDHCCEHVGAHLRDGGGVTIDLAHGTIYCDHEYCPQRESLTDPERIDPDGICELGRDGKAEASIALAHPFTMEFEDGAVHGTTTLLMNVCPTCEGNARQFTAFMDSEPDGEILG